MTWPTTWGASDWLLVAGILLTVSWLAMIWGYSQSKASPGLKIGLAMCRAVGLALLAFCLVEPITVQEKPKRGANMFVVLADDSQSMSVQDRSLGRTRIAEANRLIHDNNQWLQRLDNDFDLRRYTFGERLRSVDEFSELTAQGSRSTLMNAIQTVAGRYRSRAHGGMIVLTDGMATDGDLPSLDWSEIPPIYPVIVGSKQPNRDIRITNVVVNQTNFEAAPVNISAELVTSGFQGRSIVAQLVDEQGVELERQTITNVEDGRRFAVRMNVKPAGAGVHFYTVRAFEESSEKRILQEDFDGEATISNNQRLIAVDRGQGPYRILYVCGRPNWELKFLRRALEEDDEIQMVSLVRIAKREPKFSFRGRIGETTNPLYRGFSNQEDEQAEQYDEPVLLRLGTLDDQELRDGFPIEAAELFKYHAIILDDLEAGFFTQDQKSLLQQFVTLRGGSLLMLGGRESFVKGGHDRTPIGELLPVYLDAPTIPVKDTPYKMVLTREGWLQPWVRVRSTEIQEEQRLRDMPEFKTINRINSIKPGASVLADIQGEDGASYPALVVQKFGKGRTAALTVGDMWRWKLIDDQKDDLSKVWRQISRWLVADVPRRVQLEMDSQPDALGTVQLKVQVRDFEHRPLDNADLKIHVIRPDESRVKLAVESSDVSRGQYEASFVPATSGGYRAQVVATSADGQEIGRSEIGWSNNSEHQEFRNLDPNVQFLTELAEKTGGQLIPSSKLNRFVTSIPNHDAMVTESKVTPWWHHWSILTIVLGLFVTEWGIRRWKGLP